MIPSDQVAVPPRPYHHGDLRAALVQAGLEVTRRGGPDALVLRDVARRVGVSANAVYRHFADREALLEAVAEAIFVRVGEQMAVGGEGHPRAEAAAAIERLRAVGHGYITFALSEPGWFSVVFFRPPADRGVNSPAPPPYRALTEALDAMVTTGALSAERRDGAQWLCWSAVHGFAELVLHGPLSVAQPDEIELLAGRTVDAIITGVQETGCRAPERGGLSEPRRRQS